MKKLTYLFIAGALGLASCTGNGKGYVVNGTVDGGADGDSVFIKEVKGRALVATDTAVIKNGKFTFEGVQDSTVKRYVVYGKDSDGVLADFYLENGKINVVLKKDKQTPGEVTGTVNNDANQAFKNKLAKLNDKFKVISKALQDTTLTEEEKEAKKKEISGIQEEYMEMAKATMNENLSNEVGMSLFGQLQYQMEVGEIEAVIAKIPAKFQQRPQIVKIKESIELKKKTAVGQKYTDFAMQNPEGKTVKLSDYVGKAKYVIVDFWASWCAPCRKEMPNVAKIYKKYHKKGLEIVGVSLDSKKESWTAALKKDNMTWPQMSDLKGWQNEGAQLYGVQSIPHVMLLDKDGKIVARGLHGAKLIEKIDEVMNK